MAKEKASSINLAINALRAFYGGLLGQDIEPWVAGIKQPARRVQPPRVFSSEKIERLITVGTECAPLARVFLMTVSAPVVGVSSVELSAFSGRADGASTALPRSTIILPLLNT